MNDIHQIEATIRILQESLGLQHWRIEAKIDTSSSMGTSLMKIKPDRNRTMARIYIRPDITGSPVVEFRRLLLHEMLHLVLDPIAEEHNFLLEYAVPLERQEECKARLLRALERSVEHLSVNIDKVTYNELIN